MTDFEIVWDDEDDEAGNVRHIAEHGLTLEEVESVLLGNPAVDKSRSSDRPMVFGDTHTGRHIAVVFEVVNDDPKMIAVVTAYEVSRRTRR